jgi:hypothetical protein
LQALSIDAPDAQGARLQADLFTELATRSIAVSPDVRIELARRFLRFGVLDGAERALQDLPATFVPDLQSQLWFDLALRHRDAGAQAAHVRCLRHISERHPQQPQAAKAKFLLDNA